MYNCVQYIHRSKQLSNNPADAGLWRCGVKDKKEWHEWIKMRLDMWISLIFDFLLSKLQRAGHCSYLSKICIVQYNSVIFPKSHIQKAFRAEGDWPVYSHLIIYYYDTYDQACSCTPWLRISLWWNPPLSAGQDTILPDCNAVKMWKIQFYMRLLRRALGGAALGNVTVFFKG